MDGQTCDRHQSAQAKARVLFPNLCILYFCQHCASKFEKQYNGEFVIAYETVTIHA